LQKLWFSLWCCGCCDQLRSSEGRADCARPILWAAETKKVVDVFIIFTDQPCSTAASGDSVTPVNALRQYCDTMSRPNTRYDCAFSVYISALSGYFKQSGFLCWQICLNSITGIPAENSIIVTR